MRDTVIERIYCRMKENDRIFFVSADMGAPALDKLREDFGDRFINVGIAEQNLVNVCTGLALEGFTVFAYGIATFITMRAFEQTRTNLSLLSHLREVNVNLIGVGAGVSYDMSGPSHHCVEDLAIMRTLPNMAVCSPCDWVTAENFVDFALKTKIPKYLRLDGKPLPRIYEESNRLAWDRGFCELHEGDDICIVSTGYMTHRALKVAEAFQQNSDAIGVVDLFLLKPINEEALFQVLNKYKTIITLEEAFVRKGGLDGLVSNLIHRHDADIKLRSLGFDDAYVFTSGNRDLLSGLSHFDESHVIETIEECRQFV